MAKISLTLRSVHTSYSKAKNVAVEQKFFNWSFILSCKEGIIFRLIVLRLVIVNFESTFCIKSIKVDRSTIDFGRSSVIIKSFTMAMDNLHHMIDCKVNFFY